MTWKGVSLFPAFPLDGWALQDSWYLVQSQPPVGNELIKGSGEFRDPSSSRSQRNIFLKERGESLSFTHLLHPSLLTFHASTPVYSTTCFSLSLFFLLWGVMSPKAHCKISTCQKVM